MARRRTPVLALAALALSLTVAGCKQSDTVLLIEVDGDTSILPYQLLVNVGAGMEGRSILVPETLDPAGSITLPASFTISMDRSHMGPITVTVDAFDADKNTIAAGTSKLQHPVIGGQSIIPVTLKFLDEPIPPTGAGGQGGGGGGGSGGAGSGGQDGAANLDASDAGEAGGSDAPQEARDAADGMGLDVATD
jgi:hypothetical protein